ncbi:HNH endonuclease signature motif containing protein [Chryseobacterium sp.]|uniref:HNH endonuclease signature motif containing protein n=1 Tax=Chryseobacterium sp. TaxID=1871047 RepID=UPI0032196DC1
MTAKATHCKSCKADRVTTSWPKKGALCLTCYNIYTSSAVSKYRSTSAGKASNVASSRKRYATDEGAEVARNASRAWQKRFPEKNCAKVVKRAADKLQRTPKWFEEDKVRAFYCNKPEGLQVDHIIPLKGKLVSGLHCLANLQYLTPFANKSKGNSFDPETFVGP